MEANNLIARIQSKLEDDIFFWKNDDRAQDLIANFLFKDAVPGINKKQRGHSSSSEERSNAISTAAAAISMPVERDAMNGAS